MSVNKSVRRLWASACDQICEFPCLRWQAASVCASLPSAPLAGSLLRQPLLWQQGGSARTVFCHTDIFFFPQTAAEITQRPVSPTLPSSSLAQPTSAVNHKRRRLLSSLIESTPSFSRSRRERLGGERQKKRQKWVFCCLHSANTRAADEKRRMWSNTLGSSCLTKLDGCRARCREEHLQAQSEP